MTSEPPSSSTSATEPIIHPIFEPTTATWQYIIADPKTSTAIIIDPVLNYDAAQFQIYTESADALLEIVASHGYTVAMILETHAHADHITAASYLRETLAAKQHGKRPLLGIGSRIKQVQELFSQHYELAPAEFEGVFDTLLGDDEEFKIGEMVVRAMHLPGHTPDHMGYQIGNNVFVGDSIFHADVGSARADFPGGSAQDLFHSGRKLLSLPDDTKIWVGHDYPPSPSRQTPLPYMTVRQQREENKHLKDGITEEEFVKMREERDDILAEPRLFHIALQFNVRAGRLPGVNDFGYRLLKLPLKTTIAAKF